MASSAVLQLVTTPQLDHDALVDVVGRLQALLCEGQLEGLAVVFKASDGYDFEVAGVGDVEALGMLDMGRQCIHEDARDRAF